MTPLTTPLEIIRGTMVGAFWSARWVGLVWSLLALTGLILGAIHPAGFVAVVVFNAVEVWFACAVGTVFSLRSRSSARALGGDDHHADRLQRGLPAGDHPVRAR